GPKRSRARVRSHSGESATGASCQSPGTGSGALRGALPGADSARGRAQAAGGGAGRRTAPGRGAAGRPRLDHRSDQRRRLVLVPVVAVPGVAVAVVHVVGVVAVRNGDVAAVLPVHVVEIGRASCRDRVLISGVYVY